jgi:hypothetical protein
MDKAMLCPYSLGSLECSKTAPLPEQRCHGGAQPCLVAVQVLPLILHLPREHVAAPVHHSTPYQLRAHSFLLQPYTLRRPLAGCTYLKTSSPSRR